MASDYVGAAAARARAAQGAGSSSVSGARAGESFAGDAEVARKRKADLYRKTRKKSFAWQPPGKAGVDSDWDAFNPDTLGGMLGAK